MFCKFIDQCYFKTNSEFGTDCIAGILGDREFIGKNWLDWLNKNGIRFLVRIKANQITTNARGLEVDVSALFYGIMALWH